MKYETPCTNVFSSSLNLTDFGYSFFLYSDRIAIIVARCSSYSLQTVGIRRADHATPSTRKGWH
jgi:hypothetical protein